MIRSCITSRVDFKPHSDFPLGDHFFAFCKISLLKLCIRAAAIDEAIKSGLEEDSDEILGIYLQLADFYRDKLNRRDKALIIYEKLAEEWWNKGKDNINGKENFALRKTLGMAQNIADIYASANNNEAAEDFYKVAFLPSLTPHT